MIPKPSEDCYKCSRKQSAVEKKTIRGGRSELFRGGFSPSFQFQRWLLGLVVDNLRLSAPAGCVLLDSAPPAATVWSVPQRLLEVSLTCTRRKKSG